MFACWISCLIHLLVVVLQRALSKLARTARQVGLYLYCLLPLASIPVACRWPLAIGEIQTLSLPVFFAVRRWDRFFSDEQSRQQFRAVFGDERADYAAALKSYYINGAPGSWEDEFISAYATLGLPDAYPFVLSPAAVRKLRFVHDSIVSHAIRTP
jgi:Putative zinc-binding metallo-peptidase